MSYNGSGTFLINSAGQPVVANTVISATVFNALTSDLATGLSTAITKDGQTTITNNIPFGSNKITGLGSGTAAADAANLGQVQSTVAKLITVTGTDTITGSMSPQLTAYAAGQLFYFVANAANTSAVTLNIDSLGAKSITRDGSSALAAGDINSGEVVVVIYDGTRFQMINAANSFGNTTINGTLTVTGNTALQANVSITSTLSVHGTFGVTGAATLGSTLAVTGKSDLPTVSTASVNAAVAAITTATVTNLTATSASVVSVNAGVALLTTATVTNLTATGASITSANIGNLQFTAASIASINAGVAVITNLSATSASIASMNAGVSLLTTATVTNLTASGASIASANIGNLQFTAASIASINAGVAVITNLTATGASIASANVGTAVITAATVTGASIASANVGTAVITTGTVTALTATGASVASANVGTAVVTGLTVTGASIASINVGAAVLSGNLTLNGGTASGILYLNASKVATSGTALTFDPYGNVVVGGTSSLSPAANSIDVTINNPLVSSNGGSTLSFGVQGSRAGYIAVDASTNLNVNSTSGYVQLETSGGSVRFASSGNVGIGTTSPATRLDVVGASAGSTVATFTSNETGSTTSLAVFQRSGGAVAAAVKYNASNSPLTIDFGTTTNHGLTFLTNNTERMRLDSSGNLGIGTSSPTTRLTVSGTTTVNTAADATAGLVVKTFGSAGGTQPIVNFQRSDAAINFQIGYNGNTGDNYLGTTTSHNLLLITNNTTKATLDTSGNLGLGVTPSAWSSAFGPVIQVKTGSGGGALTGSSTDNFRMFANTFYDGSYKRIGAGYATQYEQASGAHAWYTAGTSTASSAITFTQPMTLDASGRLLVGATASQGNGSRLQISGNTQCFGSTGGNALLCSTSYFNTNSTGYEIAKLDVSTGTNIYEGVFQFYTKDSGGTMAERARITAGGDLLVGATSQVITSKATILSSNDGGVATCLDLYNNGSSAGSAAELRLSTAQSGSYAGTFIRGVAVTANNSALTFGTEGSDVLAERARIAADGTFCVGNTTAFSFNNSNTGAYITGSGAGAFSPSGDAGLYVNRVSSDGNLVRFYQDGTEEGNISVSGNTVSYNAFAGSHWSQLQDGSKPDILRGTVMESINELCVWPGEQNERLPKSKVSDTAGSKKVYGVFMAWDNDWTETNDMYVTAVGAFICRVNGSVTVEEGDLLESNGDGTARVQADDIIRSSTIGKVTSTVKTHQYDDGSYCVPTVLYCG